MKVRAAAVALRPWQWLKNLAVFPALIFAARADEAAALGATLLAFVSFCLVSSAGYLVNDVVDRAADRQHATKRRRPLARGDIAVRDAVLLACALEAAGLGLAFVLGPAGAPASSRFVVFPAAYVALGVLYSLWLKRVPLVDVVVIANGFLLRVLAGGAVIGVEVSTWLLVCTFFLSLFLAFAKRRGEREQWEAGVLEMPREVIAAYRGPMLDAAIAVTATALLVCYALYTVADRTVQMFGTYALAWTVPVAVYGVLRAVRLLLGRGGADDPSLVFWSDRRLQVTALVWLGLVIAVVYRR